MVRPAKSKSAKRVLAKARICADKIYKLGIWNPLNWNGSKISV